MVPLKQILAWLDDHAPFNYCAPWDNCGLQVGHPDAPVERLLVALDVTSRTLDEAARNQCQCLVTHHPLIFQPLKFLRFDTFPGSLVAAAVLNRIHLVAAHTNLDAAREGINAHLAARLGLQDVKALEVDPQWADQPAYGGMGRIGLLPAARPLAALAADLAADLGTDQVRLVGAPDRPIRRIAICSGSGAGLMALALEQRCDAYVTGDIRYHEAQAALEQGLALIDVGHFASERLIVAPLASYLRNRARRDGVALEVFAAQTDEDPFQRNSVLMKGDRFV
ncbi:MAG: Nif3-like dinuclear metal center hexameric protein [Syntrophobacteraceae bacterium CG2_30_61_12]|nr:MAG: Nif3-like dinuclear metal center hexameric protein [Syntrophobacteraceae bacterium CG2_30_61_12]